MGLKRYGNVVVPGVGEGNGSGHAALIGQPPDAVAYFFCADRNHFVGMNTFGGLSRTSMGGCANGESGAPASGGAFGSVTEASGSWGTGVTEGGWSRTSRGTLEPPSVLLQPSTATPMATVAAKRPIA